MILITRNDGNCFQEKEKKKVTRRILADYLVVLRHYKSFFNIFIWKQVAVYKLSISTKSVSETKGKKKYHMGIQCLDNKLMKQPIQRGKKQLKLVLDPHNTLGFNQDLLIILIILLYHRVGSIIKKLRTKIDWRHLMHKLLFFYSISWLSFQTI